MVYRLMSGIMRRGVMRRQCSEKKQWLFGDNVWDIALIAPDKKKGGRNYILRITIRGVVER